MEAPIYIVSGLPRSGTSLMMQMLAAGGLPAVTDGIREADEDNPSGYFEEERIKRVKEDATWLPAARGKVMKAISMLLFDLPANLDYRVIFMERNLEEVLASQRKMLERRGTQEGAPTDEAMRSYFESHLQKVRAYLREQPFFSVLPCNYNALMHDPEPFLEALCGFCDAPLDRDAMLAAIQPGLYRNRAPGG